MGLSWYGEERHPACPRGCGELADECACPVGTRNPFGSMRITAPEPNPYADDLDVVAPRCRWRNCKEPAETRGYCDPHFGTL